MQSLLFHVKDCMFTCFAVIEFDVLLPLSKWRVLAQLSKNTGKTGGQNIALNKFYGGGSVSASRGGMKLYGKI